ncbi:MAG: SDR family oxidoreductase [Candidatus Nanopelagicales bacterium]|nr:SDR family oxidoreductase [Candidatus Nanopelagicales bacterium]
MSYLDTLFDLTGKVIVITGGSRGLGREMAFGCAQAGADIVIASRNLENCQSVADEVTALTGRQTMAYGLHVGRWDQHEPFTDAVYERFGKVDCLINNAGMSPIYDRNSEVSEAMFDSVMNLNFKGPYRLTALMGERMYDAGSGSIINVSSTGSLRPGPTIIPYAGAKAALNTMTEGFSKAFGPRVRVNTLMAGPFLSDIAKAWSDEQRSGANLANVQALGRNGDPVEVVGLAIYLASDASSYTTSATIRCDGGLY